MRYCFMYIFLQRYIFFVSVQIFGRQQITRVLQLSLYVRYKNFGVKNRKKLSPMLLSLVELQPIGIVFDYYFISYSLDMKHSVIIILCCCCAVIARAQDDYAMPHTTDSLNSMSMEILNRAVVDNPDSQELLKVRADAYENLKQYDKAVADYLQLIQMEPDDEILWYLLGRNLYNNGQLLEALKSLNRATRLNARFLPAFHTKIQIYLDNHEYDIALKVSDSTLRIGETAMTYFMQGEVYNRQKAWQKAQWAYEGATKIDKGFIEAYIALANIAAETNKATETLEAAEAALGIDPDSKKALIARSRGFALSKNYVDAIDDVSDVIRIDPNNVEARYWRGVYYRNTNKLNEAIKDLELVLEFQPNNWQAIAEISDVYAQAGSKMEALEGYQKLLDIASNHAEKDAIIQFANLQIFELNRENRAPTVALIDPNPDNFIIPIPDDLSTITIKGKIFDESPIASIMIDGRSVDFDPENLNPDFTVVIDVGNKTRFSITAVDCFGNTTEQTYTFQKLATAANETEPSENIPDETPRVEQASN